MLASMLGRIRNSDMDRSTQLVTIRKTSPSQRLRREYEAQLILKIFPRPHSGFDQRNGRKHARYALENTSVGYGMAWHGMAWRGMRLS
jgi:hypothetical protein